MLHRITSIPELPPIPYDINVCPEVPKNLSPKNIKIFLTETKKTNDFFQECYQNHIIEKNILLEELEKMSNDIEMEIQKKRIENRQINLISRKADNILNQSINLILNSFLFLKKILTQSFPANLKKYTIVIISLMSLCFFINYNQEKIYK